jgi:predicted esterase
VSGAREHHIETLRTARYWTLGEAGPGVTDVWFVLHGHGQLAHDFISSFEVIASSSRLIVAPEGLSRFYLDGKGGLSPDPRVGASWMTREDRLAEIRDYVRYLDDLHAAVMATVSDAAAVTGLGFSQGVATVARWASRGRARIARLVLWAGVFPPELGDPDDLERLRSMTLVRVLGDADRFAKGDVVAVEDARFRHLGLDVPLVRFPGGHELHVPALLDLAGSRR